jgi:DNA polymerase elongation subunit (family B)
MFDLMVAFKQFTDAEMDSYSLAYVTESEELGIEKIPFEGSSGKCWDNAPNVVLRRNTNDVLIMKALNDKYGVIETYDELRKEFGLLFHESFVRNRVIDTALMRMVQGKVVLSTATYDMVDEEKLLGAIVIKPKKGDHYNVIQLDISRGYPTHIQGFNISPETYREKRTKDCYAVVYDWVDEKTKEPKHFEAYFDRVEMGLLPRLIKFFNDRRTFYQKEMEKAIAAKAPDSEVKMWERRQYNIKKTTNAIYGVMDYPKFRLHRKECTQATAIIGRIIIEELVKFLASIGYELKYGDTDSIFISLKKTIDNEMLEEGKWLENEINTHLDKFFIDSYGVKTHASIGLKAIYKKIKFLAPKMYGGKFIWEEKKGWKTGYDFKGISSVRSDASNLEKKAVKQVFMYELDDEIEKIEPFKADIVANLRAHKYSPLDISYPSQIKKRIWFERSKGYWKTDYAFLDTRHVLKFPAAARAVIYTNMYLNTDYATGDKPRRLPVKLQLGIDVCQQTLFLTKDIQKVNYPTQWVYRGKTGGIQSDILIKVKDIVIVEDFSIPKFFLDCIDWVRIEKRLTDKLNKLSVVTESKNKRENKHEQF